MTLYDISPELRRETEVWPGDTPLERQILLDCSRGDSVTLSTLRATVHLGAHADAFSHVTASGPSIGHHPIELHLGPCEVIHVPIGNAASIRPEHLNRHTRAPRILLHTGSFDPSRPYSSDFASLSKDLIDHLAASGVRLVGVDTPSIDPFDSKTLDAHHACITHNVAILEGLVLDHVPVGLYELIALPLRLMDFDASPVRAILRPLPPATIESEERT